MNMATVIAKNAELAKNIILDEEWNDIEVIQYSPMIVIIHNDRTGKSIRIKTKDSGKTLKEKIKQSYE